MTTRIGLLFASFLALPIAAYADPVRITSGSLHLLLNACDEGVRHHLKSLILTSLESGSVLKGSALSSKSH